VSSDERNLQGVNNNRPLARAVTDSVLPGFVLGLLFGAWNVASTILVPLMDDTPLTLASFYVPMFTAWGVAGGVAYRRTGRLPAAALSGATVALVTFTVLTAIVIARVNLFLDLMTQRPDWRNLVARFEESGFDSFRVYVNYVYIIGMPFKLAVATAIGGAAALAGGLVCALWASGVPRDGTSGVTVPR
jgi:hypothetical protein